MALHFTIKKVLKEDDVQPGRNYITLDKEDVEEHIFKHQSRRMMIERAIAGDITLLIDDIDTIDTIVYYEVKFRYYGAFAFIIHGPWRVNLIERRSLRAGDEIGFFWDPDLAVLCFSLLNR